MKRLLTPANIPGILVVLLMVYYGGFWLVQGLALYIDGGRYLLSTFLFAPFRFILFIGETIVYFGAQFVALPQGVWAVIGLASQVLVVYFIGKIIVWIWFLLQAKVSKS